MVFVFFVLLIQPLVYAQANPQINYQGKLTTSAGVAVPNGTYNMRFWILTSPTIATSSALWTESLTVSNRVQVTNGLFSVMLGSTSPLTNVNFNQTLYLAVEVGGTTTVPAWDGEMSPRRILGSVPAAFEARRLEGLSSSSLLRSDEADTMAATSSGAVLTVIQNGAGAVSRFFSGLTEVFTIGQNGFVGIGTSTPSQVFSVVGNARITGALFDGTNASGTSGMVLQTTGTTTRWVATSTLGYLSGASSISDLGDVTITTPGSGQLLSFNGTQWVNSATSSLGLYGLSANSITSAQLLASLSDETGTGNVVFSANPIFTGTATFGSLFGTNATFTNATATNLVATNATSTNLGLTRLNIGGDSLTDLVGTGLTVTSGALSVATSTLGLGSGFFAQGGNSFGAPALFGTNDNNIVQFETNGIINMTLATSGNFSIGTSSSTARLSVLGAAGSADNLLTIASSSGQAVVAVRPTGRVGIGTSTPSSTLDVWGALLVATSSTPTLFANTALTRVGIGTAVPTETFEVVGNALVRESTNTRAYRFRTSGAELDFEGSNGDLYYSVWANAGFTGVQQFYMRLEDDNHLAHARGSWRWVNDNNLVSATTPYFSLDGVNGRVGLGTTSPSSLLSVAGNALITGAATTTGNAYFAGFVGIGSSTPESLLGIRREGVSGTSTVGIDQFVGLANTSLGATQFGNRFNLVTTNTATTTIVGSIFRIQDSTAFGNTVRGLEVQAQRGTNTLGENTALSGFGRTFGVRGTTEGDAGAVFEPAGIYGETRGTTQGNAIRGYSSTITTAALLSLFQDTSTFVGTGLLMNFGNAGGSFSSSTASRFLDLKVAGTSRFVVNASGTLTIGDGTNAAGLQIGRGGLCVDSDGSCNASTSGRISATDYFTGNSDLAEVYFSSDRLEAGEIVTLAGGLSVGRARIEDREQIIGVVSTQPGLTLGADDSSLRPGERAYPIALSGRVPIRLSTENGPIKKGDRIMLSSLPGVGMKATGTGMIVGIALEDFDDRKAYSQTFINQFGENLIVPEFAPFVPNDPRINDGCYFGAGGASGEAPCVPLSATTTDGQQREAERIAAVEAKQRALEDLARTPSSQRVLAGGQVVSVGQIIMFVDLSYQYLDTAQSEMIAMLASSGELSESNTENPTLFERMTHLASGFVDGVLSIFRLESKEVQTDELCIGATCVDEATLQRLLNESPSPASSGMVDTDNALVSLPVINPSPTPTTDEQSTDNEVMYDSLSSQIGAVVQRVADTSIPATSSSPVGVGSSDLVPDNDSMVVIPENVSVGNLPAEVVSDTINASEI